MAEETTSTASDQQLSQIINQLLAGRTAQPAVDPNTGPSSREGRGILSLLGEGLGGGSQYGTTAEREQGGLGALGALGSRMLQASDWSVMPHSFGSILGQGLDAARGNLGHTQAVSAAQHYAAQQLAHEQQQDQIARLKEALPYLQLQEDQRAAARQRELLKPGSTNTNIGAAGNGPPDPGSPAGQVATRTAAFWSAQGYSPEQVAGIMAGGPGAESSFNPGAKGDGGDSHGLYQHQGPRWAEMVKRYGPNPTEAQQHEFAVWEISPQGTHAAVGAALKQAKTPQEAAAIWTKGFERPKNADDQAAARASVAGRYVGYGQAPAKAGAPAATPAAPGQATMPPPEPPLLAGTAQTAGDVGAPTGTVIPPSPPGSDATVAEIEAGRASSPARTGASQPGTVVTAQAGGQQPSATQLPPIPIAGGVVVAHPGSFSEFRAREFVPPPQTEDFNPNLTPAQQRAFASEAAAIEKRAESIAAGRVISPKEVADIRAAREEIKAKVELAAQEKAQKAAVARSAYDKEQDGRIQTRYEKELDKYGAAAAAQQAQTHEMQKIEKTAEQTRLTNKEQVQNGAAQDLQKDLNKESMAARDRITALDAALELSRNVKDPTLLASRSIGGVPMVDALKVIGMGSEAFQSRLGAIQELRSGLAAVTKALRQGVQLGTASDADLRFITSMGASEMQDDSTREAILTNLIGQQHRKMKYGTEVSKLLAKGMNIGDAMDEAEKRVPEVTPTMPARLENAPDKDPETMKWFRDNVPPNTIWRSEDGTRHIRHAPGWKPPQ